MWSSVCQGYPLVTSSPPHEFNVVTFSSKYFDFEVNHEANCTAEAAVPASDCKSTFNEKSVVIQNLTGNHLVNDYLLVAQHQQNNIIFFHPINLLANFNSVHKFTC